MIAAIVLGWLWQGLLVTATAALLLRALPRVGAATRHAVLWIALVITILIPAIAMVGPRLRHVASPAPAIATAGAAAAIDPSVIALPRPPPWLMPIACAIWAALLALRAVQLARGLRAITRIKRSARPLGAAREGQLWRWRMVRQTGRPCELRVSDERTGVCAAGLWRPMILLPDAVLRALTSDELDQIILHEHAHLLRYDDWSRLVQSVLAAMFGLHPAVWLLNRHIDFTREAACDDHVVRITHAPRQYAACLARVAELRLGGARQPAIVPAAARSFRIVRARVLRLLYGTSERESRLGWMAAPVMLIVLTATLAVATAAAPSIRFTESDISIADAGEGVGPAREPVAVTELQNREASVRRPASARMKVTGPAELAPVMAPVSRHRAAPGPTPRETKDKAPLEGEPLSGLIAAAPALRSHGVAANRGFGPSSRFDASAFTAFGTNTAQAGQALGGHLQKMGEGLGGWFAGMARAVSKP